MKKKFFCKKNYVLFKTLNNIFFFTLFESFTDFGIITLTIWWKFLQRSKYFIVEWYNFSLLVHKQNSIMSSIYIKQFISIFLRLTKKVLFYCYIRRPLIFQKNIFSFCWKPTIWFGVEAMEVLFCVTMIKDIYSCIVNDTKENFILVATLL